VIDRTAAARLRTSGDRITAVECIGADGSRAEIAAQRVIAAAHGIENAALLLRSDLDGPAVGRWLGAHTHVVLDVELNRAVDHADAATRDSGISYAWADGEWRAERASAIVIPFNPGLLLRDEIVAALAQGGDGMELRRELSERFAKTVVVYVSLEDAPREDRFLELSSRRDKLGLPRTHVSFPPDSDYVERGLREVRHGLEERLAPLGARIVGRHLGGRGGHMLGTCFMGPDGVVDEDLRHHQIDNLYMTGGSAFPTYSALHPTVTIAALAIRLGRHLASDRA
jgi:choline dehydrogenase-like flavoprotein